MLPWARKPLALIPGVYRGQGLAFPRLCSFPLGYVCGWNGLPSQSPLWPRYPRPQWNSLPKVPKPAFMACTSWQGRMHPWRVPKRGAVGGCIRAWKCGLRVHRCGQEGAWVRKGKEAILPIGQVWSIMSSPELWEVSENSKLYLDFQVVIKLHCFQWRIVWQLCH